MARSRKKVPIHGMTCAESDKPFKRREHRRERRVIRKAMTGFWTALTEDEKIMALEIGDDGFPIPPPKAFGNPWKSEKDGKSYCADMPPSGFRK